METQEILALKEDRSFHHGCQVYTWVGPVEKGLNLQPGLLPPLERSIRRSRMANGNIVNLIGCWKGTVELEGITVTGSFEVFDSGRGWDFLFGK